MSKVRGDYEVSFEFEGEFDILSGNDFWVDKLYDIAQELKKIPGFTVITQTNTEVVA